MKNLRDLVGSVKSWIDGIPSEHRAEARVLKDEIHELQSKLSSMAESYGTKGPTPQYAAIHGEMVHDHATHLMNEAAAIQSLFTHESESIRTEAIQLQQQISAKEAKLKSFTVKK